MRVALLLITVALDRRPGSQRVRTLALAADGSIDTLVLLALATDGSIDTLVLARHRARRGYLVGALGGLSWHSTRIAQPLVLVVLLGSPALANQATCALLDDEGTRLARKPPPIRGPLPRACRLRGLGCLTMCQSPVRFCASWYAMGVSAA